MNVGGSPSVELRAAMQQHFHQAHHPGVVDLDASDFGFANGDRQSDPLKQWKVDVHVQGLSFETGEASVMPTSFWRRHSRFFSPLLRPRSFIRFTQTSTRRKVLNFSYMRPTRFLQ